MDGIALLLFTYLSNQLKHKNTPWEKNFNKFGFPGFYMYNFDAQRLWFKNSYVIAIISIGITLKKN